MKSIAEIFKLGNEYLAHARDTTQVVHSYLKQLETLPAIVNRDVYVGIEIEVENARLFQDAHAIWTMKPDGSLRNNGMEWVSWPLRGDGIRAALCDFFSLLNKDHHFSPRTSIHFHLDVSKLNTQQVTGIILTYLAVEPLLYKFVGHDRDKNIYCVPMYETGLVNDLVGFMEKKLRATNLNSNRYLGLNLAAIQKFGTLEFRHLEGTSDITRIINWLNLLFSIYTFGLSKPLGDLIHQIGELNTNSYYVTFIGQVFGPYMNLLNLTDVKSDLEKGVKAVKQSTLNNKLFHHIQKEISMLSPAMQYYLNGTRIKSVSKPKYDNEVSYAGQPRDTNAFERALEQLAQVPVAQPDTGPMEMPSPYEFRTTRSSAKVKRRGPF